MANPYRITNTVGTIPNTAVSITGSITVVPGFTDTVTYTGSVDLTDYITDGNSGGAGSYVYIVCAAAADKVAKVTGCIQLGTTTWKIFTDGDMTGASSSAFSLITTPFYGYSYLNDGGAAVTVNGVSVPNGEGQSQPPPDYADGLNIGNTLRPLYVNATGSDVLFMQIIGAPSI